MTSLISSMIILLIGALGIYLIITWARKEAEKIKTKKKKEIPQLK